MKIRIISQEGERKFPFGSSGPWSEFKNEVTTQGHEIIEGEFGVPADALISHKHSEVAIQEANASAVPLSRRALILWEPHIVEKKRYTEKVLEQYGIVYAPSPNWASRVSGKSFHWPQDKVESIEPIEQWLLREKRFVIIQGNKFSARKGELYSLRRQVIKKLNERIELYGIGWNQGFIWDLIQWGRSAMKSSPAELSLGSLLGVGGRHKSYFGTSANKKETLSKYRFAIVIENSADFVSEKLFDCISAGCIVVYVGPPLKEFNLPDKYLILGRQDTLDIFQRCDELINMSDTDQYWLAKNQNSSIQKNSSNWNNSKVLRKLAHDILSDMH